MAADVFLDGLFAYVKYIGDPACWYAVGDIGKYLPFRWVKGATMYRQEAIS